MIPMALDACIVKLQCFFTFLKQILSPHNFKHYNDIFTNRFSWRSKAQCLDTYFVVYLTSYSLVKVVIGEMTSKRHHCSSPLNFSAIALIKSKNCIKLNPVTQIMSNESNVSKSACLNDSSGFVVTATSISTWFCNM